MKNKKVYLLTVFTLLAAFALSSPVQAKSKDVTKTYKKSVQKFLRNIDNYLGYGCSKKTTVKFDDCARTTIVCMADWKAEGKSLSWLKKNKSAIWKKYFTAKVNFKMAKNKSGYPNVTPKPFANPSHLFQMTGGKIKYWGGDWGDNYPVGYVKKVVQNSSTKFTVTYNIHWNNWAGKKGSQMGQYSITLKKSGNAFRISNIKRMKALVESI